MRTYNQTQPELEQDIIKMYNDGTSSVKIQEKTGVNPTTILDIVKRNGFPTRTTKQTSKRYTFNEKFFERIDTEEKAYWLGFILADGCLSRGKDVILALKESDYKHLDKFLKVINGNNKYRIVKNNGFNGFKGSGSAVYLQIRSQKMYEDLTKQNLTERKSGKERMPPNIPSELLRHFWRGVVDGDGHVCINNQHPYKHLEIGLCGSKAIVTEFSNFILKNIGVHPKICSDHSIWKTKTGCSNAVKLCTLLYDNSVISLDRKYKIYNGYRKGYVFPKPTIKRNYSKEYLLTLYEQFGKWNLVSKHLGLNPSNLTIVKHRVNL